MKKYLILFVTLLTSLIFCVSNVSAYNSTVKISTSDNWIYLNTYGMTKEEIQQYTNKYISYNSSKTSNIPDMILKCREYYETYYSEKYQYYIITSYLGNFTTEYYLLAFNEYPIYMVNYDKNYIFNDTYNYNRLKILISENKSLDFVYFMTTNGTSFTNKKGFYMMYSGVVDTTDLNKLTNYYETNYSMDFYLNPYDNGSDIYSKFYYDDKIFSPGDIVFNTMVDNGINIIKPQGPKIYKYEDEIDTSNLSYIKINYNTTGSTYDDYSFVVMDNVSSKLKEAYFEKSYDWGICLDENTCYDKYVYRDNLYYTKEVNMYSASFPFKIEDSNHGYYDETQELDYFYAYYDVSSISDIVTLSIDSTKEFSVELGYMEDYVDTFVEIDLKNYAGIVLFPKVNLYNGDYVFYLKNADVNVHHYYENNLVNIYKNITVETYWIDQVEYQDRNRYYLIENNKVDQDSYISFDTRYFSYQLVNTTSESITITNPNTNEDQNINSIDSSNLNYDILHKLDNVDSFIDRINEFIDDTSEYFKIISDLISYAYNSLNSYCQTFIIFVFVILIIVGLILLLRR